MYACSKRIKINKHSILINMCHFFFILYVLMIMPHNTCTTLYSYFMSWVTIFFLLCNMNVHHHILLVDIWDRISVCVEIIYIKLYKFHTFFNVFVIYMYYNNLKYSNITHTHTYLYSFSSLFVIFIKCIIEAENTCSAYFYLLFFFSLIK